MFGRNRSSGDGTARASFLRGQEQDLADLEAAMRKARQIARDCVPRDRAADRALQRDLDMNIRITKANIRDLQD